MGFKKMMDEYQYTAALNEYMVKGGYLRLPWKLAGPTSRGAKAERLHIGGARAELESGDGAAKSTLARVGAGALLFGPAGAIVGGMFKKDSSRVYVTVTLADERVVVCDAPKRDWTKAKRFTDAINAGSVHYATDEQKAAPKTSPQHDPDHGESVATLPTVADRIRQLGQLRDEGLLSDAEYESKKTELLSDL